MKIALRLSFLMLAGAFHVPSLAMAGSAVCGGITCVGALEVVLPPNTCTVNTVSIEWVPPASNDEICFPVDCTFSPALPADGGDTVTVNCTGQNNAMCSTSFTVVDTQPPTVQCPAGFAVQDLDEDGSEIVTFPSPSTADNCPGETVECAPPSGASFPIGETVSICTVQDARGNTANCLVPIEVTACGIRAPDCDETDGRCENDPLIPDCDDRPRAGSIN